MAEILTSAAQSLESVCCLVGGKWSASTSLRAGEVFNPSTGKVIACVPFCTRSEIDQAAQAAHEALPKWRDTPVVERARVMFRFRDLLVKNAEELARSVTREHGKTLAESRASVQRGIEVVEFACGVPSLIMGQSIQNIARNVDCETIRHPIGVCAGITPFNFPAMVPLWMYPIAITCGNTFVLKPSEKVPLTAVMIGKLLVEAGVPAGVFNIVHGNKEAVDALLTHPLVKAISFVGSTPVARYIYETGTKNGKRVQSAGGAKNHLIIMPDADLDQAASALQSSAFGCAGERCMAGSIAVGVGNIAPALVETLRDKAGKMKVGPTENDESMDMGPLITRAHLDKVTSYLNLAVDEGASLALDGRSITHHQSSGFFLGPTVIDRVKPEMRVAKEEIFGPVLSIIRAKDLDEALALSKNCEYGNGASIFTKDGYTARQFKQYFNAGMIGINIGVPAPMAWFPFAGWNKSFFGDLHVQGTESIQFYTQQKMTMTRWFESHLESHDDPVWETERKP